MSKVSRAEGRGQCVVGEAYQIVIHAKSPGQIVEAKFCGEGL